MIKYILRVCLCLDQFKCFAVFIFPHWFLDKIIWFVLTMKNNSGSPGVS